MEVDLGKPKRRFMTDEDIQKEFEDWWRKGTPDWSDVALIIKTGVPRSKWQEFKQKYFPNWLKKIWKVKFMEYRGRITSFSIEAVEGENLSLHVNAGLGGIH